MFLRISYVLLKRKVASLAKGLALTSWFMLPVTQCPAVSVTASPEAIPVAPHWRIDLRRRQLPLKYLFDPPMRTTPCWNSNAACLWNHTWPSNNSTGVIFTHHHLLTQQHPTVKGLSVFTTADLYSGGASSHCSLEGAVNLTNTARLTSKATGVKSNMARRVSQQLHAWCHRRLNSSQEPVFGWIRNKSAAFVADV